MDKKIFKTLIKKDHKLGENKYVHGRISGFQSVICNEHPEGMYATISSDKGLLLLTHRCTAEQYEKFRIRVAEEYPGLCEFDVV